MSLESITLNYEERQKIDNMVKLGATLRKMEGEVSPSRETIRKYIKISDQYQRWMQARNKPKEELESLIEKLIYILNARINELVQKESWAYQKAFQVFQSRKKRTAREAIKDRFDALVALFKRYQDAQKNGRNVSLEELGSGLGMYATSVSQIFRAAGVKPMYGSKERHPVSEEIREMIRRCFGLYMPAIDIAYFLDVSEHVVNLTFHKMGKRHVKRLPVISGFHLTYRLLSQVYGAQDTGSVENEEKGEISMLLHAPKGAVMYAINNRHANENYQQKIVTALRTLFADDNIKTPYIAQKR